MSCNLSFSQTYEFLTDSIISLTITVTEVYTCTNIQLRLRSNESIVQDWFDYAIVSSLTTTINFPFSDNICFIDVRLSKCCVDDGDSPVPPGGGGGGGEGGFSPPVSPDDPPCSPIATSFEEECSDTKVAITNPYVKPDDVFVTKEFNDIYIPKKVQLNLAQTNCCDIKATICTVRCAEISIPDVPKGECSCNFQPSVDIFSLPQINIGRLPYGVPLDIDINCSYASGRRFKPQFSQPEYTKVVAYYYPKYFRATPFIDGVGYDISNLNINSWVEVHTASDSTEMRNWLIQHFRFFTLDTNKQVIQFNWPYTDLIWHSYDSCIPNGKFTPEDKTVYIYLIPC